MLFLFGAVFAAIIFVHPYITYPLTLKLLPRRPLSPDPTIKRVSATLVFCAYNEARSMPDKIANLQAIRDLVPDIRFKAYVDLGTDDTAAILNGRPDLIEIHHSDKRTGKALGMRRLVASADTDIIIFTDANVIVEPTSIQRLLDYFTDQQVGGVCGTLILTNAEESATANIGSAYWRLEELIKKRESRSGSTMGADGSIFATRRRLYPHVPGHLLDDFIVSMSVIFAGHRLISAPDVIAYERVAASSSDEFRRKRRIACRAYSSHRYLLPQLRAMSLKNRLKYLSHRVIRWFGALWAALALAAAIIGIWQMFGTMSAVAALILLALATIFILRAKDGLAGRLAEIAWAIIATMLGVIDALRGKRYQTWQPPQTR